MDGSLKNVCTASLGCGPGSVVGIETGYGLDGPAIESRRGRDFLHPSGPDLGPTMGTGPFPGLKRPGRGVDQAHLAPRLMKE